MICKQCGTQINGDEKFCPVCGARLAEEQPVAAAAAPAAPAAPAVSTSEAKSPMVFGILSIVFSGLLGLIFAIVSKTKLKRYYAAGGPACGMAKAGKITSTIGLIFSILAMIAIFIWTVSIIALLAMGGEEAFRDAFSAYGSAFLS